MKKILGKGKDNLQTSYDYVIKRLGHSMKLFKDIVNDLPILVSFERIENADVKYDEKHYFVIPDMDSACKFTLHTMRHLPVGVPEINDLKKRRIFHLPNSQYEPLLYEKIMHDVENRLSKKALKEKNSLEKIADELDNLDNKITGGMLLIGGLSSFVNPAIGISIATKAIIPGMAGILSKYGIRPLGEKISKSQVDSAIRKAEKKLKNEFSESDTITFINPILMELVLLLESNKNLNQVIPDSCHLEWNTSHWETLTKKAVLDVYNDKVRRFFNFGNAKINPETEEYISSLSE